LSRSGTRAVIMKSTFTNVDQNMSAGNVRSPYTRAGCFSSSLPQIKRQDEELQ